MNAARTGTGASGAEATSARLDHVDVTVRDPSSIAARRHRLLGRETLWKGKALPDGDGSPR